MKTKNGREVRGAFTDGENIHGLVHIPYTNDWFHAWWDACTGKCLMPGAGGKFDLESNALDEIQAAV